MINVATTPPLGALVRCDWEDIVTSSGWQDSNKMSEITGPHTAVSVGYVSFIHEGYIVLSSTISPNAPDQFNNHISIPIGCITSIQTL